MSFSDFFTWNTISNQFALNFREYENDVDAQEMQEEEDDADSSGSELSELNEFQ